MLHTPRSTPNHGRGGRVPQGQQRRKGNAGFTIVELMLVLVVMGLLLAVAYPSYLDSVRKGRRAEAVGALAALQQAQERFRANNAQYAGNLNSPEDASTLKNIKASSANGLYNLAISGNTASGYTAIATAQGAQAADTQCKLMGVRIDKGDLVYGSGSGSTIDWADPGRCWAK